MLFRSFLASVRADGLPSLVEIVRSHNGGEFFNGEFESACNELLIKQEFTPAYSSQCNSVAERGLGFMRKPPWRLVFRRKFCLGMCCYLRLTDSGLRQCTGLERHLITPRALQTLTRSRRMKCGMENLVMLDRIRF